MFRTLGGTTVAIAALLMWSGIASGASLPNTVTATGRGATITAGPVTLTTKAAVTVQIAYVCDPLDENGTPVSALVIDQGTVSITEAVNKSLAQGQGIFSGNVTCDSSTVNHFTALVVSTTVPFKAAAAVIDGEASSFDFNFCCPENFARVQAAIKIAK